jgi:hypothetical protein
MNIKKILYGLGGLVVGLLLDFFEDKRMAMEVEEQVQKALEERGLTDGRPDSDPDHVIFEEADSGEGNV